MSNGSQSLQEEIQVPNIIAIFPGLKRELGGCEIYRTTMPFHYLQEKIPKWRTSWSFIEDILYMSKEYGSTVLREMVWKYDIFVFPRIYFKDQNSYEVFEGLIYGLHQLGKRAIYEVDDDMTNQYRQVVDGDAIASASLCDTITVSTPHLSDLMHQKTGKPTYVLPNMFSPDVWHKPRTGTFRYQDKIVLGLTGSTTHKDDWEVLGQVLPDLMHNDKLHLIIMGYHPDYLTDLPNTTYLPGVTYERYAQVIQSCDIILAPVNNDPFNLSKSPIKCIEGMAARRLVNNRPSGAACIASDHPIYRLSITNEKNGLLVDHTPQGWSSGLTRLIEDVELRHHLQYEGHRWVDRHHNIEKQISLWSNAYGAALNRKPVSFQ